jgi:4-amino-4-deoxy-L-arabinose transferase-like glycosyltransferase
MTQQEAARLVGHSGWHWIAGFLIFLSACFHTAYLANDCPLDLAPDEAHYWDWSRRLDWSYYSKGPLVAYVIRASCEALGGWSVRLTGTEMLAVRVPAIVCSSLLLISLYVLTLQIYGRAGLATAVVAIALTFPPISAGATLMTIDAPFTCCWGWALVLGYRAMFRQSAWAWPLAGLVVGLGILAKYTMVLFLPSVGIFLLFSRKYRGTVAHWGFWLMTIVALVCCLPIIVWNAQHDWASVRHLLGLAGANAPEAGVYWLGPLNYLGVQAALLLIYWFVVWATAMIVQRPGRQKREEISYLWWLSAPVFLVFWAFSFKTGGGEPNWPVTAYMSGLVLAAGWLVGHMEATAGWYRRLGVAGIVSVCVLGVAITVVMHRSEWLYPILGRLSDRDLCVRQFDPTCRLRGWKTLTAEVDRLRESLRARGVEPVVAGTRWSLAGELAFYCDGRPSVYSLGLALGDRHSQYDFWTPNPLADTERFRGRTFIVVGEAGPGLATMFDHVEPPSSVTHYQGTEPVARWAISVGHGYKGCPASHRPISRRF